MIGFREITVKQMAKTDTYVAARKLGLSINYLIRNATRGEGDTHGAVDQFAEALCIFVDHVISELSNDS